MIKIILAEDHNIVRNGIKSLLMNDPSMEIIAEGSEGDEVLSMTAALDDADVLLADINMSGMDGITLTKELAKSHPDLNVLILSMLDHENYVFEAFKTGAKAYLLKNVSADELIFAIKHVAAGGMYFCSELSMKMLLRLVDGTPVFNKEHTDIHISERELEMLKLLAEGFTNQEMADKLFVSKRTVEGYRQQLIEKTKSKNTASLIKFSITKGII